MKSLTNVLAASAFTLLFGAIPAQAQPTGMRVAGNFSANGKHVGIERSFFTALPKLSGIDLNVNYNTMDAVSVQAADALRLLRSGTFDVMSVQIGMASRDDPFFEGVDLIGVSTNMKDLRKAVDASATCLTSGCTRVSRPRCSRSGLLALRCFTATNPSRRLTTSRA